MMAPSPSSTKREMRLCQAAVHIPSWTLASSSDAMLVLVSMEIAMGTSAKVNIACD